MDSGASSGGASNMVFVVSVFVILAVALYYFYKWLNGSGEQKDAIIYTSPDSGLPGKSDKVVRFGTSNSDIPGLYEGGEFSVSTWVYITNWGVNKGYNKPFLTLSGGSGQGGYATMVMYLGQNVNKLGIRVSTEDNKLTTAKLEQIRPVTGNGYGVSPYTDAAGDFKKCDIESIDMQRWVNITAVLNGRTLDVYIDGKMSRSCVLSGMFKVDGDSPELMLGGPYGFGGIIGQTVAANFAYSPDRVYKIYQNGPLDTSILSKLWGIFNPAQYSLSISRNGEKVV
jgi:hypothetical protein